MKKVKFDKLEVIHKSLYHKLYKAFDTESGAQVVLKTGSADVIPAAVATRLAREYKLMQRIDHPNVVKALGETTIDGRHHMVMEFCSGMLLNKVIKQGRMSLRVFHTIAKQIAQALIVLHNTGIIHKDVNPANIIYNPETERAVLLDFGIASEFSYEKPAGMNPGDMEGSIYYIAPEQTGRINAIVDYRADFYSLGITFYEMLTGHRPFEMESQMEVIFSHIAKIPPDVRTLAPDTPPMLAAIIEKLLAKMAKDRYASAEGLLYDLVRCKSESQFILGEKDFSRHFEFSQRIYGRELESLQLRNDYKEVTEGAKVLVTVSGYSGVGKTSLVNAIQEDVVHSNGLFLSGKFDQYHRNAPYYAFFQALEQFCGFVLSESESDIRKWKSKLRDVLTENGSLLTDKVPTLHRLAGYLRDLGELTPLEERTRFKEVLQNLLAALAKPEHPLTLFLDDVHLADMGSMEILEEIQKNEALGHLMIIVSYRDNEVDENHPLTHSLNKIIRRKAKVTQIHLTGISEEHAAQMIGDSFNSPQSKTIPLAKILYKKTGGNPFYIKQFLRLCHMKQYLYPDMVSGTWQWDERSIQNCPAQENVVDFLLDNMNQIPESAAFVLSCCACIGQSFYTNDLAAVCDMTQEDINDALKKAVELEVLFLTTAKQEENKASLFQFSHDRFQQAFYTSMPQLQRAKLHYKLGKRYEQMDGTASGERIYEIADHYSKSLGEAQNEQELQHMKNILLDAAHRCALISAFDTAARYLELLLKNIGTDKNNADFMLSVYIDYHAVLCNMVKIEECDRMYEKLSEIVQNPEKLVDSCCLHITSLSNRGKYKEAFLLGTGLLKRLGVDSPTDGIEQALMTELTLFYKELEALGPDHVLTKSEAKDSREFAIAKLYYRCCAPGLFYNPLYLMWVILASARRIFKYGYTPEGLQVYSNLMIPMIALNGDYRIAYTAGKAAMQLAEKHRYKQAVHSIYHLFALHTCHWFESVSNVIPYARESIKGHAQMGDFEYACFGYFSSSTAIMETSSHIDELWSEIEPAIAFADKTGNHHSLGTFYSFRQFIRSMRGELALTGSFDGTDFSENAHLERFAQNNMAMCYYHVLRAMSATVYRDYKTAYEICRRSAPLLPFITGFYPVALHSFLYSLSICKMQEYDSAMYQELSDVLDSNQAWLKCRTSDAPGNFGHLYLMVEAEREFGRGNINDALLLYEKALTQAHNHEGYLHHAIICDLVAVRYEQMGIRSAAEQYIFQTYQLYSSWGAEGKCMQMKELHHDMLSRRQLITKEYIPAGDSTVYTTLAMDINSVMKASLAISEELQLEGILEKLIYVLLENAGAQNIYYLVKKDSKYKIQAEGHTGINDTCVLSERIADVQDIPFTVVQFVEHSLETVILDHASASPAYARDPHIKKKNCKSILCMPVLSKGELKGILYMENNLATGVFDKRRKESLVPIAAQLAISLENAYLYEHLRFLVDERTKELQEEIQVRKKAEENLAKMAHYDSLTGLPNRRLFHEILSKAMLDAGIGKRMLAVLFVDLDGFKAVNDTYGHEKGDQVLIDVSERLTHTVRTGDTVSRIGGDEFILILNNVKNDDEISQVCERILRTVGEPIPLTSTVDTHVTPSIGISIFPHDSIDAEELVILADGAMYYAKRNNKNQYTFAKNLQK